MKIRPTTYLLRGLKSSQGWWLDRRVWWRVVQRWRVSGTVGRWCPECTSSVFGGLVPVISKYFYMTRGSYTGHEKIHDPYIVISLVCFVSSFLTKGTPQILYRLLLVLFLFYTSIITMCVSYFVFIHWRHHGLLLYTVTIALKSLHRDVGWLPVTPWFHPGTVEEVPGLHVRHVCPLRWL